MPQRLLAAAADLCLQLMALSVSLVGVRVMGVDPSWKAAAGPLAVLLLVFSFLYTSVPLAFWGRTPGMAWRGLVARNEDATPLTFSQVAWRWIGSLLTVAGAGLPALLAFFGGGSLSDRISRSLTHRSEYSNR